MNKVYIVLVNYNNYGDTIECLESVLKSDYINFQVFVIDNSIDNNSVKQLEAWANNNPSEKIKTDFEHLVLPPQPKPLDYSVIDEAGFAANDKLFNNAVTIIRAKNEGFAAANNIALKYILDKGDESSLIWILNNDTVVEKDTLKNLVSYYLNSADKKILLGAKLKYYHNRQLLQAIAGHYNTTVGRHIHIGEGIKDAGQFDNYQPQKNDYIVGASIFVPRLFLEKAGLMCADYFLYFEELDWINTGIKKGFKIAFVADAVVYHKEGASIIVGDGKKKDTSLAEYYSITNRVRFIKKWHPVKLPTVMIGVTWALVKRLMQGKIKLAGKCSGTILKILLTKNTSAVH